MKIGAINNCNHSNPNTRKNALNFEGKYYLMSDTHTRAPMSAGVLSEIEKRAKLETQPVFLIDGGDFMGDTCSVDVVADLYVEFKKQNPHINCVFNFGNLEFIFLMRNNEFFNKITKKMQDAGINIVSSQMDIVNEKYGTNTPYVKPYAIVEDEVEGKVQKILVSGVGTLDSSGDPSNIEIQKKALKSVVKSAVDEHKPDKVILMMHDNLERVNGLLDYAKKDLGIENIELVVGGHPHKILDAKHGKTRMLFGPAQGKGAYVVENTPKGFEFGKFRSIRDKYNYTPLSECKPEYVITNLDISNPLPVASHYSKILNSPVCAEYNKVLAKSVYKLMYRDDYPISTNSRPTSLGTFMSDALKKQTGSDIGLILTLHYREKFPTPGHDITKYNFMDVIHDDKDIYTAQNVSVAQLKSIFETSLRKQTMGKANSDFFEYSSNIKLVRRTGVDENEDKVVQIYYKENGKWKPLLDENSKPIDSEKKFSIATTEYAAKVGRPSLNCFEELDVEKFGDITIRDMAVTAFNEAENSGCPIGSSYECSSLKRANPKQK